MTRRRLPVLVAATLVLAAACDDDSQSAGRTTTTTAPPGTALCTVVRAWSDQSADALEAFRLASRGLDERARRTRYEAAFHDQAAVREQFAAALSELRLPDDVRSSVDGAVQQVAAIISDGEDRAATLPDTAYRFVAVSDGTLYTSTEKARAVVFQALTELSRAPGATVPRGCGQRGPLDLSPSATFPP
jgi:hypothetical protein